MRRARTTRRLCLAALVAGAVSRPAAWAEAPPACDRLLDTVDVGALDFDAAPRPTPFQPWVGPGSSLVTPPVEPAPCQPDLASATGDVHERQARVLDYRVGGILTNGDAPLALVNGQVLGVGETIEEGGTITAITAEAVGFTYEGRRVTLPIGEE